MKTWFGIILISVLIYMFTRMSLPMLLLCILAVKIVDIIKWAGKTPENRALLLWMILK